MFAHDSSNRAEKKKKKEKYKKIKIKKESAQKRTETQTADFSTVYKNVFALKWIDSVIKQRLHNNI